MKIAEILNKVTDFILHFNLANYLKETKFVALLITIIFLLIVLLGTLFSLIPQF